MQIGEGKKEFSFSISVPDKKECTLFMYRHSESKPFSERKMKKLKNGVFFTNVDLSGEDIDSLEYIYKADGEEIPDIKAKRIIGREQFGKRTVHGNKKSFATDEQTSVKYGIVDFTRFKEDTYVRNTADKLVLYELQIRSFTMHESSKTEHPGTFCGASEKVSYLKKLGITGVMLMPVFDFDECSVPNRVNLWGYACRNTYFFAPKASFSASGNSPKEYKQLIEKFHKAGIDVYMDMMFTDDIPQSIMLECMRMYACVYGVDGFKINNYQINPLLVLTDENLGNCRLFVSSADEALLSRYRERLLVMNDTYRNDMRRYLKGDEGLVPAVYNYLKNRSEGSVVGCLNDHNGFTLYDLYTYDIKHNLNNGENNRDGADFNYSWNCGEEGSTNNKRIKSLRLKMMKNAAAALFLTGGVPMISAGDEFGHTKLGNNNTYCQDNEISYLNWDAGKENKELYSFVKNMIVLRHSLKVLNVRHELRETDYKGVGIPDISLHGTSPWLVERNPYNRLIGAYLCGDYVMDETDGEKTPEDVYILFNMHWEKHEFVIPKRKDRRFTVLFDTAKKFHKGDITEESIVVEPRSIVLLKNER